MFEIGSVCMKIAGRDARDIGIVIDVLDEKYVLIDGNTRKRKCNINHLKPLDIVVKLKKNASHSDVEKALEKLGIEIKKGGEKRERKERPRKTRKGKNKEPGVKKEIAVKEESKKEARKKK